MISVDPVERSGSWFEGCRKGFDLRNATTARSPSRHRIFDRLSENRYLARPLAALWVRDDPREKFKDGIRFYARLYLHRIDGVVPTRSRKGETESSDVEVETFFFSFFALLFTKITTAEERRRKSNAPRYSRVPASLIGFSSRFFGISRGTGVVRC